MLIAEIIKRKIRISPTRDQQARSSRSTLNPPRPCLQATQIRLNSPVFSAQRHLDRELIRMAFFWNIASIPPLHLPQAIPRAPSRFPDRAIAVTGPALTVAHYLVNATQPSRRLFFCFTSSGFHIFFGSQPHHPTSIPLLLRYWLSVYSVFFPRFSHLSPLLPHPLPYKGPPTGAILRRSDPFCLSVTHVV